MTESQEDSPIPDPGEIAPRLRGPFVLLAELGRGGAGVVYLAEHRESGERVALKTLRCEDEATRHTIRREVYALSRLSHPGIVKIREVGVDGPSPWYAMELLQGTPLSRFARSGAPPSAPASAESEMTSTTPFTSTVEAYATLAPEELPRDIALAGPAANLPQTPPLTPDRLCDVLALVRDLCAPLAYMHGEGIVHRDLKPANVMILPGRRPVIVDFGIAITAAGESGRETLQALAEAAGTPWYMAPEQLGGGIVDPRADLYSLGCLLHELISGVPPFHGCSLSQLVAAHLHQAPPRLRATAEGVPDWLDELVARLLAKKPRERLGHAGDVAATLERHKLPPSVWTGAPPARTYLYRSRMAGREEELRALRGALEQVRSEAAGGLTLIGGESGAGKTRLLLEIGRAADKRGVLVLTGECAPTRGVALGALRNALRTIAGRHAEDPRALGASVGQQEMAVLGGYEPVFLGPHRPGALPALPELPPEAARARILAAVLALFRAVSAAEPVLLIIDDLQWADDLTSGLLELFCGGAASMPMAMLVLAAYRSEEVTAQIEELRTRREVSTLSVGALRDVDVTRIVSDMLGIDEQPTMLARDLCRHAEGNPFFVSQYLLVAVHEGLLQRDAGGVWRAAGPAPAEQAEAMDLPLPHSVRDLLLRRLTLLSEEARHLCRCAAVVGRDSPVPLLEQMAALDQHRFLGALEELRCRDVLDEVAAGYVQFRHDKLHEIAYEHIEPAARRALHGAVARWYEVTAGAGAIMDNALMAHHWGRAGCADKAADYLERAGIEALQSYSNREALGFLGEAMRLRREQPAASAHDSHLGGLARRLGEAHVALGAYRDAEQQLTGAARLLGSPTPASALRLISGLAASAGNQLAARLGGTRLRLVRRCDPAILQETIRVYEHLGEIAYHSNRPLVATHAAARTLQLAERLGPSAELARAFANIAVAVGTGPLRALAPLYERLATAMAERIGSRPLEASVWERIGLAELGAGRWAEAAQALEAARATWTGLKNQRGAGESMIMLACCARFTGAIGELATLGRAIEVEGVERGDAQHIGWGGAIQAQGHLLRGQPEAATAALSAVAGSVEAAMDATLVMTSRGLRALAYLGLDDVLKAVEAVEQALRLTRRTLMPASLLMYDAFAAPAAVTCALLDPRRGPGPVSRPDLLRLAGQSCRALRQMAWVFPPARAAAATSRGLLLAISGRPLRARRALLRGVRSARALKVPLEEIRAHLALASVLEDSRAADHRAQAVAIAESTGLSLPLGLDGPGEQEGSRASAM
ncbi:MAG: protein kinase [Candidatus Schekmanbacteria bacterium]|nr:protein kinase [Candidatus Schekmanbacteria bacterium]